MEYKEVKITINIGKANIYGLILLLPVLVLYGVPYFVIWKEKFTLANLKIFLDHPGPGIFENFYIFFIFILAGVVAHELIHGITWAIFAKQGWKSIRFGVMWKLLTPYCHCKGPLKIREYILGALMPACILGLVPGIISIINGSGLLLIFGVFFTIAAIGDFMIVYLLRNEKADDLVQDHPSEAGCIVFRTKAKQ